jgi:alkylhydroperoxidase family enzyme
MGVRIAVDLHSKDARALGETEQRLYVLGAWEEARFYSERERAALALTDAANPDHGRSFA